MRPTYCPTLALRDRRTISALTPYGVRRHYIAQRASGLAIVKVAFTFAFGLVGLLATIIILGAFAP
jgi:hypothetical protein